METNRQRFWKVATALIIGLLFPLTSLAQEGIDRFFDQVATTEGVRYNKIVQRDQKTKKPWSIIRSISFTSKGEWARKFAAEFKKASKDCDNVQIKEGNSKGEISAILSFQKNPEESTIYKLNSYISSAINNVPYYKVTVFIIYTNGNVREKSSSSVDHESTDNTLSGYIDIPAITNF